MGSRGGARVCDDSGSVRLTVSCFTSLRFGALCPSALIYDGMRYGSFIQVFLPLVKKVSDAQTGLGSSPASQWWRMILKKHGSKFWPVMSDERVCLTISTYPHRAVVRILYTMTYSPNARESLYDCYERGGDE